MKIKTKKHHAELKSGHLKEKRVHKKFMDNAKVLEETTSKQTVKHVTNTAKSCNLNPAKRTAARNARNRKSMVCGLFKTMKATIKSTMKVAIKVTMEETIRKTMKPTIKAATNGTMRVTMKSETK